MILYIVWLVTKAALEYLYVLVPPDCTIYCSGSIFGPLSPSSGWFVYTHVRISGIDLLGVGFTNMNFEAVRFYLAPNLKHNFEEISTQWNQWDNWVESASSSILDEVFWLKPGASLSSNRCSAFRLKAQCCFHYSRKSGETPNCLHCFCLFTRWLACFLCCAFNMTVVQKTEFSFKQNPQTNHVKLR